MANSELAKVLEIKEETLSNIDKVSDKILKIENASKSMEQAVNSAWDKLKNGGIKEYLLQLGEVKSAMDSISQTTIKVDTTSISAANTNAEKLASNISKVAQSAQMMGGSKSISVELQTAISRYNELQRAVDAFNKKKKEGLDTKADDIRITKVKEEMRILEAKIPVLRANNEFINTSNQLLQEQIAHLTGTTLEMQKSSHILSQMSAYYKDMEKSSANRQKTTDSEDAKALKTYNSLQSRLTTLTKTYNELRLGEPFSGQQIAVDKYAREIAKVERELDRLEDKYPKIKAQSDQTWSAKRIVNYVNTVAKQQERIRDEYDKTARTYKQANLDKLNTPSGALGFASSANTYARQIKAIQFLENAYKSLGKTEADVATKGKLAEEMQRLRGEISKADAEMGKFKNTSQGLFNYSQQLSRAFALLFSVSQIRNYIRQIKDVTAEFEKQKIALGSLLQSQDKANELFGQITNLAVRSPFTIKELNSYTKQLAAYNIQYENLFDTTKMLADVSAGLGVDMQRLILAFGQVKAATVLRGCLGKGTKIQLFNGDYKLVEDVVVGDELMGDNGTMRTVKETIVGREQMYKVCSKDSRFNDYRVNENHILTLFDTLTQSNVDIYVLDYLKEPQRYLGATINGTYEISVERDIVDDYYGFVIDGNKRFVIEDSIITHNTEVRQFTEAGFGILGELAKYYTELEGRLVSVGDVQDRITKKMVKFADVEEIFKRVTSAGGMFYNMQEKLAQTLAGRWSNLTDRIELMMNEIGQSNMAIFNALIGVASTLAENWELVATALQVAVPLFVQVKVTSMASAAGITSFNRALVVARKGLRSFSATLKTALGPVSLLFIALEAGYAIFNRIKDATERNNKALEDYNRNAAVVAKATKAFNDIAKATKSADETDKDFAKRQYNAKIESLTKLRQELQNIGYDEQYLPDMSLINEKNVDEQAANLQKAGKAYVDFSNQFRGIVGRMADGVELFGVLGDNIKTDANDLVKSASKMNASITTDVENIKNAFLAVQNDIDPDTFNELFDGLTQKEGEDAVAYAERLRKVLEELEKPYSPLTQSLGMDAKKVKQWASDALSTISNFQSDIKELEYEADALSERLIRNYYGSKEKMQQAAQENPLEFAMAIRDELAREQIEGFAQEVAAKRIILPLVPTFDWSAYGGSNQLTQWKKDLLAIPSLEGLIDEKSLENFQSFEEFLTSIQSKTKTAKEANEEYGKTIKDNTGFAAEQLQELIDNNNETIKKNEAIAKALGVNLDLTKKEDKEAKTRNDYLKESVSLIEKMGKEYDDALDSMGKTAAKTDISTRYSSLLSDLADKAGMDGTAFVANLSFDTSGIISALQKVADAAAKAGATEAEQAAREAIAKIQGEDVKIEVKANVEGFERELDNVLAQYQLGKELSKLGLGKELTESLFNFESIDLDTARAFVEKFKATHTDTNGEIANDYKEAYEKALKEVTNLENKELQERLKSYQKYLKQSMSDAVAIKLEEARQLDEINKMEIDAATKAQLREGVKRETSEKYDKAKWEEFKNSDMYIQMFEDLDYMSTATLHRLRNRLIEIKDSLHDLSPESLKEIQSQFDKIDEVITQRNPFKELAKSLKAVNDLRKQGRTREVIEEEIEAYDVKLQQTQQEIQLLEKYIGLQQQGLSLDNLTEAEKAKLVQYQGMQGLELQENLDSLKEYYDIIKLVSGQASFELTQWDDLGKDLDGVTTKLGLWGEQWDKVAETAKEALDMMGVDSDSIANTFIDLGTNLKDIGLSALQQAVNFKTMGIAANSALGVIGWIAIALQGIVTIFSSLFKAHDKRLENQIEMHLEKVEELERAYEDLEKSIESAYSSSTYDQAQDDAIANLEAQNKALERAQAAERDKKKTDQDRIDEWEQQKLDNLEKIAELERQAIEAYGGFGSDDNIKSAAEDFVSAWLDAFNETGNGLDALSDKMDEWIENALQKQLLMRLSEQYITPLLSQFDQMFEETSDMGRQMSQAELEAWKKIYEKNSKEFDEKAKAYLNALDIKPTGAESELSGLQRGIEGVTETTAQALEALLNSMRYYVSDSNNLLRQFYMSFISADETMNPMLYELKQHTTLLNAIHSLLNSTTKMTNNNGRALKVLMM